MKWNFFTTTLLAAALLSTTSWSFGQGCITFINTSNSRISTNSAAGPTGGSGPTGFTTGPVGSYYYALLVAPIWQTITTTNDPTLNGWTFTGVMGTNTAVAGRMIGGNTNDGSYFIAQIPGYSAVTNANFAVVGWSANIGTTWAQAQAWWNN